MSDAAKDAEDKARFSAMEIEGPMKLQLIGMNDDEVILSLYTAEKYFDEFNADGTENFRFGFNVSRPNFDTEFPAKIKEEQRFANAFLMGVKWAQENQK